MAVGPGMVFELFSKLATLIDWSKINEKVLQEMISNPRMVSNEFVKFIENRGRMEIIPNLRLVLGDTALHLAACDGTKTIAQSKALFPYYLDTRFGAWGLDKPNEATDAMKLSMYEIGPEGSLKDLMDTLGVGIDALCLSQHQIVDVCDMYRDRLRQDGSKNDFIFKQYEQFFLAHVTMQPSGLSVNVSSCADELASTVFAWEGGFKRHYGIRCSIVVPQQNV